MSIPFKKDMRVFGLSDTNALAKRLIDLSLAIILSILLFWVIAILAIIARIDTGRSGIFTQTRIGLFGDPFTLYKLRSMREVEGMDSTVTTDNDPRITAFGRVMRKLKLDELPQLLNVLNGTMSFVGPRPDVASTYDSLSNEELVVLTVRPGITGPASIFFRDEEVKLANVEDPEQYNREVVFPEKLRLNRDYIENYSILSDFKLMRQTLI